MNKFDRLCEIEGITGQEDFLTRYGLDSVIPGICANNGCDFTREVEPDQARGWCEDCQDNTVHSGLVLLGVI